MDSASIFRAGATAQKQFSMDRGFQILKVASNAPDVIRVSFPPEDITNFMATPSLTVRVEEVALDFLIVFDDQIGEEILCGYSKAANTFAFKEVYR